MANFAMNAMIELWLVQIIRATVVWYPLVSASKVCISFLFSLELDRPYGPLRNN